MFTIALEDDQRLSRVATLDIETNGVDGRSSELVAIGVGYHDAGSGPATVDVLTRASVGGDERAVVDAAADWLNQRDPDGIVTYNGEFDFGFLEQRADVLGCPPLCPSSCADVHVDLFRPRKRIADLVDEKWPSLEEALAAYDIPAHVTTWEGHELTNGRFGEELAPRYLAALAADEADEVEELEATIVEYTAADIEANLALYAADAGREYEPRYSR